MTRASTQMSVAHFCGLSRFKPRCPWGVSTLLRWFSTMIVILVLLVQPSDCRTSSTNITILKPWVVVLYDMMQSENTTLAGCTFNAYNLHMIRAECTTRKGNVTLHYNNQNKETVSQHFTSVIDVHKTQNTSTSCNHLYRGVETEMEIPLNVC